jgi:hypothetical protein
VKTYWNGERCPAVRVRLAVGPPPKGLHPEYWAAYHIGQIRDAVRVDYNGRTFYFDDEDWSAWAKVTDGRGSPGWPSRSLYGTEVGPAAGAAGPRDDDGLWADCGDAQCARLHIADPDTASGRCGTGGPSSNY